jgi:hypothetical protein
LNPYSRPQTAARSGDPPKGAQLLSTVRQAPRGGRDLYASPDGNIYRRQADGWYRRQAGGNWSFAAPLQGQMQRNELASALGAGAGGGVYRPAAGGGVGGARAQARGRVPDAGFEARPQEIAALERQYYARSLGQMRAQNSRPQRSAARPVRPVGRRR